MRTSAYEVTTELTENLTKALADLNDLKRIYKDSVNDLSELINTLKKNHVSSREINLTVDYINRDENKVRDIETAMTLIYQAMAKL